MRLWNSLDKRIPAFSDFFLQIIAALLSALVRCKALADVRDNGAGKRYLIQHSAGSGKSNSIASHQLIGVKRSAKEVFDSVIVPTGAFSTIRFGRRSSGSCRSARPLDLPSIPAIFASSSNARSRGSNGTSANVQGKADRL
jgi:hypothetical protein